MEEKRHSNDVMLGRIDERTEKLVTDFESFKTAYVTKDEFNPVRNIAYGLVATICLGVVGAILFVVVKHPYLPIPQ